MSARGKPPSEGEPPSNGRLVKAMQTATESGDPAARRQIYAAFGDSALIVPIRDGRGSEPEVRGVQHEDGRVFVLAFTDADALRSWSAGSVRWASMRGRDLASFAAQAGASSVVVNPAGPHGGELHLDELKALAGSDGFDVRDVDTDAGMTTLSVLDGARLALRPAPSVSRELVETVRDALSGRTDVVRAYALESSISADSPVPTLGLELADDADPASVAAAIGARLPAGREVDVLPLADPLASAIRKRVEPVWTRELPGA